MSHEAYAKTQTNTASPREAEYLAFAKATRGLMDAEAVGRDDLKGLAAALHFNRQLWGTLASDCANAANGLPEETRATIISLARWVMAHSSDVLQKREDLGPLIDVNRMMMDGLSGKSPDPAAA